MATKHGNKRYFQILLDPNRSELFEEIAMKKGIRPTTLIREILYQWVEKQSTQECFEEALRQDKLLWRQSVERRLAGRARERAARKSCSMRVEAS